METLRRHSGTLKTERNLFWDIPKQVLDSVTQNIIVRRDANKELGKQLAKARKAAGLTQVELALRLKLPQSFVSKYERGERRLDLIEFGVVATAIGFNPSKFLLKFYAGMKQ